MIAVRMTAVVMLVTVAPVVIMAVARLGLRRKGGE